MRSPSVPSSRCRPACFRAIFGIFRNDRPLVVEYSLLQSSLMNINISSIFHASHSTDTHITVQDTTHGPPTASVLCEKPSEVCIIVWREVGNDSITKSSPIHYLQYSQGLQSHLIAQRDDYVVSSRPSGVQRWRHTQQTSFILGDTATFSNIVIT